MWSQVWLLFLDSYGDTEQVDCHCSARGHIGNRYPDFSQSLCFRKWTSLLQMWHNVQFFDLQTRGWFCSSQYSEICLCIILKKLNNKKPSTSGSGSTFDPTSHILVSVLTCCKQVNKIVHFPSHIGSFEEFLESLVGWKCFSRKTKQNKKNTANLFAFFPMLTLKHRPRFRNHCSI